MISHQRCKIFCVLTLWWLLGHFAFAQQAPLITYTLTCPDTVRAGDTLVLTVSFDIAPGWHVYAPHPANEQAGMQAIGMSLLPLPAALSRVGSLSYTPPMAKGAYQVFMGSGHTLEQQLVVSQAAAAGPMMLRGSLAYQACNDHTCYPPTTEPFAKKLQVVPSGQLSTPGEADTAWARLAQANLLFTDASEQAAYAAMRPLDMRGFEDAKYKQKAAIAYYFWKRFPDDPRRGKALAIFLSADPWFIAAVGNEALDKFETWADLRDANTSIGSMAIDTAARNVWLELGDALVAEVLTSSDSAAVKERAAFARFARDYRLAAKHFSMLNPVLGEADYWQPHYERFNAHVEAYANLPNLGARAEDFLSALKGKSPLVAADYWRRLQQVPALRETAGKYLQVLALESGTTPLEMMFTAMDGAPFDLADLRGKVVLVDFWATWCKPCITELPHLKAMYNNYRNQGFEVVGICLDDESARERATEILLKHGVDWPQRFEGVGFNDDAYRQLFGINALPTVWLLNGEGKIIAKNLRGDALNTKLAELLN